MDYLNLRNKDQTISDESYDEDGYVKTKEVRNPISNPISRYSRSIGLKNSDLNVLNITKESKSFITTS